MNAILALEDGTFYRGVSAGAPGETTGEVVFNTSMTGYQEVLTDPSYAGQIVTMTAPQIGNYGVAMTDEESESPQVAGFIMRDPSPMSSNWRAQGTLRDYLTSNGIVAIGDIDTRALTRKLRSAGVMRGIIATGPVEPDELVERAQAIPKMEGSDLVKDVTMQEPYDFESSLADTVTRGDLRRRRRCAAPFVRFGSPPTTSASSRTSCAAWPRMAAASACSRRRRRPRSSSPGSPDGIFLSNGPGDPAAVTYAVDNVRELVDRPTRRCSASAWATS